MDGRRFCRVWTQWTSNFRFVNMHWNRQMPEYSFSLGIEGTFYQQIIQANKIKGCFSLDFLLKWTIQISFARIALSFWHNCSLRYGCDHINTNRSAPCMSTNNTIHLLPATEREHSRFSSIRKMPSHIIITDIIAANSHRKWHWSFSLSILYVDADTGINESSIGNAFSTSIYLCLICIINECMRVSNILQNYYPQTRIRRCRKIVVSSYVFSLGRLVLICI